MSRMHKPDPKLPIGQQGKRSVVPLQPEDVDTWLHAPAEHAARLVKLAPQESFLAARADR